MHIKRGKSLPPYLIRRESSLPFFRLHREAVACSGSQPSLSDLRPSHAAVHVYVSCP